MKRTQNHKAGNTEETNKTKWVIAKRDPGDSHFQFLRNHIGGGCWLTRSSEAATFNSRIEALRALAVHQGLNIGSGAFVAKLSACAWLKEPQS